MIPHLHSIEGEEKAVKLSISVPLHSLLHPSTWGVISSLYTILCSSALAGQSKLKSKQVNATPPQPLFFLLLVPRVKICEIFVRKQKTNRAATLPLKICQWRGIGATSYKAPQQQQNGVQYVSSSPKILSHHSLLSSSTTSCLYLSERNDRFLVMHHQHAKGGKGRISCSIVVSPTYRSDSSFLSC